MAAHEESQAEEGANVTDVGGSSSQPFNIANAFQFVMLS